MRPPIGLLTRYINTNNDFRKTFRKGNLLEAVERGTTYDHGVEEAHKKASPQMLMR